MKVQAVTANRLLDGVVVYFTEDGAWSEEITAAQVFETKETANAALERAAALAEETREVVDPYLFPVSTEAGSVAPVSAREIIRTKGPTVRLDLGKQAWG